MVKYSNICCANFIALGAEVCKIESLERQMHKWVKFICIAFFSKLMLASPQNLKEANKTEFLLNYYNDFEICCFPSD